MNARAGRPAASSGLVTGQSGQVEDHPAPVILKRQPQRPEGVAQRV
jgi:hypothetical protein